MIILAGVELGFAGPADRVPEALSGEFKAAVLQYTRLKCTEYLLGLGIPCGLAVVVALEGLATEHALHNRVAGIATGLGQACTVAAILPLKAVAATAAAAVTAALLARTVGSAGRSGARFGIHTVGVRIAAGAAIVVLLVGLPAALGFAGAVFCHHLALGAVFEYLSVATALIGNAVARVAGFTLAAIAFGPGTALAATGTATVTPALFACTVGGAVLDTVTARAGEPGLARTALASTSVAPTFLARTIRCAVLDAVSA